MEWYDLLGLGLGIALIAGFLFLQTQRGRKIETQQSEVLERVAVELKLTYTGKNFWGHQFQGKIRHRPAAMLYSLKPLTPSRQRLILSLEASTGLSLMIQSAPSSTKVLTALPSTTTDDEALKSLRIKTTTQSSTNRLLSQPEAKQAVLELAARGTDLGRYIQVGPSGVSLTVFTTRQLNAEQISLWFMNLVTLAKQAELIPAEPGSSVGGAVT